jgi:hypothetical protein
MSIGEFFRVKRSILSEQFHVVWRYYPKSFQFALSDLLLGLASFFFNPYRICRKRGLVYGETPLSTLHKIADACHLTSTDVWLDLGSGRGKGCLWISAFAGCRAIGVERIALFAFVSRWLAKISRLDATFESDDIFQTDFSRATCVYLFGTCLSEREIARLAKKMEALPLGARVVSISSPLPGWGFTSFPVAFPWGETQAYLHVNETDQHRGKTETQRLRCVPKRFGAKQ